MIRTVRHQCYFQREPAESEAALRRTVQTGSSWREVRLTDRVAGAVLARTAEALWV